MAEQHLLSATNVTDLPLPLQSQIISCLIGEPPRPPVEVSLDANTDSRFHLSPDLLSVAKASRSLSAATADALGPRARYLDNSITGGRLPEWITVLAPYVRYVSAELFIHSEPQHPETSPSDGHAEPPFHNVQPTQRDQPEESHIGTKPPSADSCRCALQLLKALCLNTISLQVLNLTTMQFHTLDIYEDQIFDGLLAALETSCNSLRELALPAMGLCAEALSRVTLPKLMIMEVALPRFHFTSIPLPVQEHLCSEIAFIEMLQALEGHADRSRHLTTVTQLRVKGADVAWRLGLARSFDTPGLFTAVKALRFDVDECSRSGVGKAVWFTSLFKNMESLHWDADVTPYHLHIMSLFCKNFHEFHFRRNAVYELGLISEGIPEDQPAFFVDPSLLGGLFAACDGKLKTLDVTCKLSLDQMKLLGERNSNLRLIKIEVDHETIAGLAPLIGNCRQLRTLDLTVSPCSDDRGFGADGWRTLTGAICSASDELSEVIIRPNECNYLTEKSVEPPLLALLEVVNFLGDRARTVRFNAFFDCDEEDETELLLRGLCRLLRKCAEKSKNMQDFDADFELHTTSTSYVAPQDRPLHRELLKEKRNMLDKLPYLRKDFSLGRVFGDATHTFGTE